MAERDGAGRPHIEIDPIKLETMLQYGASQWECAAAFGCSEDTIVNFIKKNYETNFSDYRARFFGQTQLRLKQAQIRMALGGAQKKTIFDKKKWTSGGVKHEQLIPREVIVEEPPDVGMLIWLGKQLLGQSEEAKIDQDLEKLRERFERPIVRIEVQNSSGETIQQLEHKWSDQAGLPWIPEEHKPMTNGHDKPEAKQEDDLDDLLEADS